MSQAAASEVPSVRAPAPAGPRHAPPALVWAALLTVYLVWGSTYLAIRVAVQTMPPLLMASARYLVAGLVMLPLALRQGDRSDRPTGAHWRAAFVMGALLLAGGNGGVSWAEQRIPSGLTALLVGAVPLWMALFDRLWLRRRLGLRAGVGLVLGFVGVGVLAGGPGQGHVDHAGLIVMVLAPMAWALGSLYSRHAAAPSRPFVGIGMELLAGGLVLAALGLATGEASHVRLGHVSTASLVALGYLVVFGTWVAFSAYTWLLRNARTSLVSTYAYVNPVVAVILGWAILNERVTGWTLGAGGVIVVAVALIVSGHLGRRTARVDLEPVAPRRPGGARDAADPGPGGR